MPVKDGQAGEQSGQGFRKTVPATQVHTREDQVSQDVQIIGRGGQCLLIADDRLFQLLEQIVGLSLVDQRVLMISLQAQSALIGIDSSLVLAKTLAQHITACPPELDVGAVEGQRLIQVLQRCERLTKGSAGVAPVE